MEQHELYGLFAVVWSEKQQAFHVETIAEMLQRNVNSYYHLGDAGDSDWICVSVAPSRREARSRIQKLKDGMDLK
jgi:hypothetical protein